MWKYSSKYTNWYLRWKHTCIFLFNQDWEKYYTPPLPSVNVCVCAFVCLSAVSPFCCSGFLAGSGPAAPDAAHESGLIGRGASTLGRRCDSNPLRRTHAWITSQLNPAHGGQRGEKGQSKHAALKVRCGDTDRARTSTPGGGVGLLGVWVARWHRRQLSSPMQVNSIMHLWWALKYHRARRMVWADVGRIASCNDGRGTASNYRLIFHSGQVLLMLPNQRITVYTSRNGQVTLKGSEYVFYPTHHFC